MRVEQVACLAVDHDFVLGNAPPLDLRPAGSRLDVFVNIDSGARKNPFARACQAEPLGLVRVFKRHEDVLRRDLRRQPFEQYIEVANQRPLKVVESESMRSVKDEGDAGELCRPSAENSGFWT